MDTNPDATTPYEPPRVERILSAEDLEREVQYAGHVTADAQ